MSTPTVPVLGLVARPGEGEPLRPLVRALASHVAVHAVRAGAPRPDALLATSPEALSVLPSWAGPTAVWVADERRLEAFRGLPATVPHTVVTPLPEAAEAARAGGAKALLLARRLNARPYVLPRWPIIRRRWRERQGLPDRLVVVVSEDLEAAEAALAASSRATGPAVRAVAPGSSSLPDLLGSASVAVVLEGGDALLLALAYAAPTVTSATAADEAGAEDDREVLVAGDLDQALSLAVQLAGDDGHAGALAAAAARLSRLSSPTAAARRLLDLLGLSRPATDLEARLEARLDELELPVASPLRLRLDAAFDQFPPLTPRPLHTGQGGSAA